MIGLQHGRLHAADAQPRADAFDEDVQRIAAALVFGQKAHRGRDPGRGVQAAQAQAVRRRQQADVRQPLGQQAAQVHHGLPRLGRADDERLRGRQRAAVQALQVERPFQLERQHAQLARAQPQL